MADTNLILLEMQQLLREGLNKRAHQHNIALDPAVLVRQICENIAEKRLFWLGKGVYVPNRLVSSVVVDNSSHRKILEDLLCSADLQLLLNQYIDQEGLKMFDKLTVEIQPIPNDIKSSDNHIEFDFKWADQDEIN